LVPYFGRPGLRGGRPNHPGVHERNPHFGRCGHAGTVRVCKVQAGEEEPGVSKAHPVDVVRKDGVLVLSAVLVNNFRDTTGQFRVEQIDELFRIVQRIAAPESLLLGKLCEGQEPFGPADVAQAPAARGHWQLID
jgi:hypothetical protein